MLKSRGMRILSAGVVAVLVMGTACPVFKKKKPYTQLPTVSLT